MFEDVISDIKRYKELDAQGGADDKPVRTKGCELKNYVKIKYVFCAENLNKPLMFGE